MVYVPEKKKFTIPDFLGTKFLLFCSAVLVVNIMTIIQVKEIMK
jgi:hypothetical protein